MKVWNSPSSSGRLLVNPFPSFNETISAFTYSAYVYVFDVVMFLELSNPGFDVHEEMWRAQGGIMHLSPWILSFGICATVSQHFAVRRETGSTDGRSVRVLLESSHPARFNVLQDNFDKVAVITWDKICRRLVGFKVHVSPDEFFRNVCGWGALIQ